MAITAYSGSGNTENATTPTKYSESQGALTLVSHGEDFVSQGFVTKDNRNVNFERVAVNVENVTAYQTKPAFDPDQDGDIQSQEAVNILDEFKTVQLQFSPEDRELLTQAIIG
ncbi:conserved hypothetical protein [Hyella patelloides LEGE 07179]|uniref:Uncharacterized protein n=1 Tax=Hyella patelloides LEGE 07179 TaxID=945734 RepID=A0A563VQ53_9CYAN|nr:hypothetical protein [Hyella patelloides]VEP13596.1 conserved hypothetical protein [Hyella patelloides LEGE 07179]